MLGENLSDFAQDGRRRKVRASQVIASSVHPENQSAYGRTLRTRPQAHPARNSQQIKTSITQAAVSRARIHSGRGLFDCWWGSSGGTQLPLLLVAAGVSDSRRSGSLFIEFHQEVPQPFEPGAQQLFQRVGQLEHVPLLESPLDPFPQRPELRQVFRQRLATDSQFVNT